MTKKRNRRGIEARRKEVVWVPFVGGVVVSWLVSFSCVSMSLSVPSEQCVISIREQRRPDRSCGEVSLIATQKEERQNRKLHVVLCVVVSVFGSVPLLASV